MPTIEEENYKVDPHIQAAIELQSVGKNKSCIRLLKYARTSSIDTDAEERIGILCRMLFKSRAGSDFVAPFLGNPSYVGTLQPISYYGTMSKKWPLEPIELVDGVPFAVVHGYIYQGIWDPGQCESYVRYCMTNCDWSNTRFTTVDKGQKEAALQKLLSSPKWERPLNEWEKAFLAKQIE